MVHNGAAEWSPRALVDAACLERVSPRDLEGLSITVLQRRMATPQELDRELWQRPDVLVGPVRAGLQAFTRSAWSRPEAVLRRI